MFEIDSKKIVFSALFTSLIVVGGFISIPIGLVPVTLADFFVMVSASLQNPICAVISVVLYIVLGLLGFPVFALGKSGLAVLLSPTGGFLLGYIALSIIMSFSLYSKDNKKRKWYIFALVSILANAALYTLGIAGFIMFTKLSLKKAISIAFLPFLPASVVKILANYFLYKKIDIWRN